MIRLRHAALLAAALTFPLHLSASDHDGGMSWRASGLAHFEQGVRNNLRIESGDENLVIAQGGQGFYLPQGSFLSPFRKMEHSFNAFQVGYGAVSGDHAEVEVQVRALGAEDGGHTRWYTVTPEDEVLLEQPYRYLQYRVRMYTADPETTPRFSFLYAQCGLIPSGGTGDGEGTGSGAVPKPEVVSRDGWGAKPPKSAYSSHTPRDLVVHHTFLPKAGDYTGAATIRGIQRYHQNKRGWKDIGYHFLVGPDGIIYQGRPETVVGAHVIPNRDKVGVCLIGDFETGGDSLPEVQREAALSILTWLASRYGVDPQGKITGHRDWWSTGCPGDELYAMLPDFRSEVADRLSQGEVEEPEAVSWLEGDLGR